MLPTFSDDVPKVRHALNVCSGNVFVLSENRLDFAAKFRQHVRMSHKKTTSRSSLAGMLQCSTQTHKT